MNVTFHPAAKAQTAVPPFTQSRINAASLPSTIASQARSTTSESGFFSTILDAITFIPRKIWGFIQMIFCCSSQSLADRIASDPKAAAKSVFEQLEKATDPKAEWQKVKKELDTTGDATTEEWKNENISKCLTFIDELAILTKESEKKEIIELCILFNLIKIAIREDLEKL